MWHPDRASEPDDLCFEMGQSYLSPLHSYREKNPSVGNDCVAGANKDTGLSDICINEHGGIQMLQTHSATMYNTVCLLQHYNWQQQSVIEWRVCSTTLFFTMRVQQPVSGCQYFFCGMWHASYCVKVQSVILNNIHILKWFKHFNITLYIKSKYNINCIFGSKRDLVTYTFLCIWKYTKDIKCILAAKLDKDPSLHNEHFNIN